MIPTKIKLTLIGAPGSGKGTQSQYLVEQTGAVHVSSGDVLRHEVAAGTEFGKKIKGYMDKGEIGPVELITEVVLGYLDSKAEDGFILDGFPRTVYQASALAERHSLNAAILIDVSEEAITSRITGRRICPSCDAVYHIESNPPVSGGVCDHCNVELITRKDDNEEVVGRRLEVYAQDTRPVIDFYSNEGLLRKVDGEQPPERVRDQILEYLGS